MTPAVRRTVLRFLALSAAISSGGNAASAQQASCGADVRREPPEVAPHARRATTSSVDIPASIRAEHEELWAELDHATVCSGRVGEAARMVAQRLRPHFAREEQIALPPLALLLPLSTRGFAPEMVAVLPMSDSLAAELPRMLQEHREIRQAVERLAEAARSEMRPDQLQLAERLRQHAQTEEEVLYPAAIMVGKYVRLWLTSMSSRAGHR